MDHWSEKGEYTPPMNCDLLGELVGPWVLTRVLPTSLEADLVLLEDLDPALDLILDPPIKHLKGEDLVLNHLLGHL